MTWGRIRTLLFCTVALGIAQGVTMPQSLVPQAQAKVSNPARFCKSKGCRWDAKGRSCDCNKPARACHAKGCTWTVRKATCNCVKAARACGRKGCRWLWKKRDCGCAIPARACKARGCQWVTGLRQCSCAKPAQACQAKGCAWFKRSRRCGCAKPARSCQARACRWDTKSRSCDCSARKRVLRPVLKVENMQVQLKPGFNTALNRRRVIASARRFFYSMKRCFVAVIRKNPDYKALIFLTATFNSRREVQNKNVTSTVANPIAKTCLTMMLERWSSPRGAVGRVSGQLRVHGR